MFMYICVILSLILQSLSWILHTQGHSSGVCKLMSPSSVKEINAESRDGTGAHNRGRPTHDVTASCINFDTVDKVQSYSNHTICQIPSCRECLKTHLWNLLGLNSLSLQRYRHQFSHGEMSSTFQPFGKKLTYVTAAVITVHPQYFPAIFNVQYCCNDQYSSPQNFYIRFETCSIGWCNKEWCVIGLVLT